MFRISMISDENCIYSFLVLNVENNKSYFYRILIDCFQGFTI